MNVIDQTSVPINYILALWPYGLLIDLMIQEVFAQTKPDSSVYKAAV